MREQILLECQNLFRQLLISFVSHSASICPQIFIFLGLCHHLFAFLILFILSSSWQGYFRVFVRIMRCFLKKHTKHKKLIYTFYKQKVDKHVLWVNITDDFELLLSTEWCFWVFRLPWHLNPP